MECDPYGGSETMKPRPLYRWKSVWLGLTVLVLFGWLWLASSQRDLSLQWANSRATSFISITSSSGAIKLYQSTDLSGRGLPVDPGWGSFSTAHVPVYPARLEWRQFVKFNDEIVISRYHSRVILIGYWSPMLVFLLVWFSCVSWRWTAQRRGRRDERQLEES